MPTDFAAQLFDIDGLHLTKVESDRNTVTLHIEMERQEHPCPECGVLTDAVHDYRQQKIKEVSILGKETTLILRKRRYVCKSCCKRFPEKNDLLPRYARMTARLTNQICWKLENEYSFSSVAREVGTSVSTVIRTFDQNVCFDELPVLEQSVAIDEFKGNTGREKYQCIVTDPEKKKVLDILPDRHKRDVKSYFLQWKEKAREKVTRFISDMWKPYQDTAAEVFSNAVRVVDKYHWIRQVIWAFEAIRKQEQEKLSRKERLQFKRSRVLLNKRFDYLKEEDQEHVTAMLQLSERLHKAHRIKDDFLQVLDCDTGEAAEQTLDLWLSLARNSGLKEFVACCDTIEEWKPEILHSFDCPYTNGYTEGCNNRIKVLKRNAYGYRNFGRFRNRILHMFSGSYRRRETEKAAQNGQP